MLYLAQSGTQNPLVPSLTEIITGLIAFFIVFGVLAKVLMPRIQQTLQERTAAIEGGLDRAEEAQAEAARLLESAHAQINSDRQQALATLRGQVGELAVDLAGRIVGESLADEARASRVVDRFLDELDSSGDQAAELRASH